MVILTLSKFLLKYGSFFSVETPALDPQVEDNSHITVPLDLQFN